MAQKQSNFIIMQEYKLSEVNPEILDFLQIYHEDVKTKILKILSEDPNVQTTYEQLLFNHWRDKSFRHATNFVARSDNPENLVKALSLASKGYCCKNFSRRNSHNLLNFEENNAALEEYTHCITFNLPVLLRLEEYHAYAVVDEKQYRCYAVLDSFCSFGDYVKLTVSNSVLTVEAQIFRTALQQKKHLLDLD